MESDSKKSINKSQSLPEQLAYLDDATFAEHPDDDSVPFHDDDLNNDFLALAQPEDLGAMFSRDNFTTGGGDNTDDKTNPPQQSDDSTTAHSGFQSYSTVVFGHAAGVISVPRNLDLSFADREDDSSRSNVQDSVLATNTPSVSVGISTSPNLPEPPTQAGSGIAAVNDYYSLNKVGNKHIQETNQLIVFDAYPAGSVLLSGLSLNSITTLTVENENGSHDIASIIDAQDVNNLMQHLQIPWEHGNIKDEQSGNLLMVKEAGVITFTFDSPVYAFGWEVFNLEYGPDMDGAEVIFYDKHGRSTTVPYASLLDMTSPFYQAGLHFGSSSANRIDPIDVIDLVLSEIVEVQMKLPAEVAIANIDLISQHTELLPNSLKGDLIANDAVGQSHATLSAITFNFANTQSAQQFMQNHSFLQASQQGHSITINNFNQSIPTPLGGTLTVDQQGHFLYQASSDFTAGEKTETFTYMIQDANHNTAQAVANIALHDNVPVANDIHRYITTGESQHMYNLVFVLDISGSMDTKVYNHTRLEMAQDALVSLITHYETISSDLNITVIPFGSGTELAGAFSYAATGSQDAIDFVMKQNDHAQDGVSIEMINPNTGQSIEWGTFYDTALYYARDTLQSDITNPDLEEYQHIVYFISDGIPNVDHAATDRKYWPAEWGSWQDFIQDTQSEVPNALTEQITAFAVGIDPKESLRAPLMPIATDEAHILEPDANLFTFSQSMLGTAPESVSGNVLNNDLYLSNTAVVPKIIFAAANAAQYIADHQIQGAKASSDNTKVIITLPEDGAIVTIATPQGGMLQMDNGGHYHYTPGIITAESTEEIQYVLYESVFNQTTTASLLIHLYPEPEAVTRLLGGHQNDTLSSEKLSGIVYMEGGRGVDEFEIDLSNKTVPLIYIEDLLTGDHNKLLFKNASDQNHDGVINLTDVITDFHQTQENGNLSIQLNNADVSQGFTGTELILENMGTVPGPAVSDLIDYFEAISLYVGFI